MKKNTFLPPTLLLIYLLLALIFHFLFPFELITGSLRIFGVVLIAFGLVLNLWADKWFKKEKSTVKPNKIPTKLITKGPFRFSRHPMYLGFFILLMGVAVVLGSLLSFVAPIMMFFTLEKKFIPYEEKQMEKYFGEKYLKYKNQVRRWL